MLKLQTTRNWKEGLEPQAELIGSIVKPEVFKEYLKIKNRISQNRKKDYVEKDGTGGYTEADAHYDPNKGLLDKNGKVLIPKEEYEKMTHLDGIAISL